MLWYLLGNKPTAPLWGKCSCVPALPVTAAPELLGSCKPVNCPHVFHSAFPCLVHWSACHLFLYNSISVHPISCSSAAVHCTKKWDIYIFSNIKAVKDVKIWYSISILVCHRKETDYTLRCALLNFTYTEFYQDKKSCPLCWVFHCRSVALWRILLLLICSNEKKQNQPLPPSD